MPDTEQEKQNEFMIEKMKERPVNKKKLIRRTMITAAMAVIFGLVACLTFLVLEPVISNVLYPEEEPQVVVFPEDQEEMSPEEMLSTHMQVESEEEEPQESVTLEQEQIQEILDKVILDKEDYQQIYNAMTEYVEELKQYMVTVTGVSSQVDWFNNITESSGQSSGVIVANNEKELLILVDYRPIMEAEELTLTFYNNIQVKAEIKKLDSATSLAILSVNLEKLDKEFRDTIQVAQLGSSNLKSTVGTPVVALGSPMGTSNSIGYGMVTSANSQLFKVDANYKLLITDIYGSPNAEGVLFNLQGQIVGIITENTTYTEMKNLITAYGISDLRTIMEKMSNGVPMAYLGITGTDVTKEANEELQVPLGAYVKEVMMDSPAMLAGIQQGDVIVGMDDRTVVNFREYTTILMQMQVGQTVEVTVMRQVQEEFKEMSFTIICGEAM